MNIPKKEYSSIYKGAGLERGPALFLCTSARPERQSRRRPCSPFFLCISRNGRAGGSHAAPSFYASPGTAEPEAAMQPLLFMHLPERQSPRPGLKPETQTGDRESFPAYFRHQFTIASSVSLSKTCILSVSKVTVMLSPGRTLVSGSTRAVTDLSPSSK